MQEGVVLMKLTIGKDRKLRSEQGEVLGTVTRLDVEVELEPGVGFGDAVKDEQLGLELSTTDVGGRASASNNGEPLDVRAAIDEVRDHYWAVMKPRSKSFGPQERAIVREALKVATKSECKRAIDGCRASSFHMGENDHRRKYNALSQILKGKRGGRTTREQIDFFLDIAAKSGVQSGVPSGDIGRINAAKRDVFDGMDFPNDDHVQARARESEEWLRSIGMTFDRDSRRFLTPGGEE